VSTNGVRVEREELAGGGRLARVTIDNRGKLNSLGRALLEQLIAAAQGLAADPELRLVILTGAPPPRTQRAGTPSDGRAFIGGADIGEIAALDRDSARGFITLVHRCCQAFRLLPAPVIARIDGYALGAGLELAASCDLRVASEGSRFGMPEVRIGIPSVVEAALLPRLVGWGRARRLLLTGEMIDAAEALAWGLVDSVAPAGELDAAVARLSAPILAAGPQAIRLQKALIREWENLPAEAAIGRGIDGFARAFEGDEPSRMAGAALAALKARRRTPPP
jgi:enoyl-CoA hydratase